MSEQGVTERPDMESLFELLAVDSKGTPVSELEKQQIIQSRLSSLITAPFIDQHNLDTQDIDIIALFLNNAFKGSEGLKATDIIKYLNKKIDSVSPLLKQIIRLKSLGVIQSEGKQFADNNIAGLLSSKLRISNDFLNQIFNACNTEKQPIFTNEPYKDNYEYLSDQLEKLKIIISIAGRMNDPTRYSAESTNMVEKQEEELKKLDVRIARRLQGNERVFPFEKMKAKKHLSGREELIVLGLLYFELQKNDRRNYWDPLMIINDLGKNQYEKLLNMKLCRKGESLDKKGLIDIFPGSSRLYDSIRLKDEIALQLVDEQKHTKVEIENNGFFELVKPSVSLDNVVLAPAESEKINIVFQILQGNAYQRLKEWNIKGYNMIQHSTSCTKNKCQSINMLFYGPPGTGKTLAAHALAHKLDKEILTFDCSKILDMWLGNSEKNTRKIFDKYKEITKGMKNQPVLLLNEADQFLHKRLTNSSRSVDHMYNQIQNIFLEQMEKFEGLLIATTNLAENLDTAFSRRFYQKIEFRRPGPEERLKLWRIHLPEKAPLAEDVNIKLLANSYPFSGGQIAMVVRNASVKAAIKADKIYQADFIKACEEEMRGNFDEKAKARMGF